MSGHISPTYELYLPDCRAEHAQTAFYLSIAFHWPRVRIVVLAWDIHVYLHTAAFLS